MKKLFIILFLLGLVSMSACTSNPNPPEVPTEENFSTEFEYIN